MAGAKRSIGEPVDWYLVSVDRLRKFGLVFLVLILGGGGYWYWHHTQTNPRLRAESRVADAGESVNELANSKAFASFRQDFERAQAKLAEAKSLLAAARYADAESAAVEAQSIARAALARQPGERDSDAQFLSVEGDVQYQKAASSDWKSADARMPLFNGDWVKTGSNASAELIFANGSLYTIGPNALLEIYSAVNPATSKKQNTVQMQVGTVEINTSDDISTVKTPGTQVVISSESTAQVGVDATQKGTQVAALKGSSAVTPVSGGPAVQLAQGETVRATKEGSLSPKKLFLPPPALQGPPDNSVYRGTSDSRVQLSWTAVPNAAQYQLQVSRSRLFGSVEINAPRATTSASVQATSEGSFYWRVASVDAAGEMGPFSPFRRFRVIGIGAPGASSGPTIADKIPPSLQVGRPFRLGGGNFMIEGRVEPGSTVFINDDPADVQSDGAFKKLISFAKLGWNNVVVKAVDPAGNETVQVEKVHVKENE